jgi:hypothetical protein
VAWKNHGMDGKLMKNIFLYVTWFFTSQILTEASYVLVPRIKPSWVQDGKLLWYINIVKKTHQHEKQHVKTVNIYICMLMEINAKYRPAWGKTLLKYHRSTMCYLWMQLPSNLEPHGPLQLQPGVFSKENQSLDNTIPAI